MNIESKEGGVLIKATVQPAEQETHFNQSPHIYHVQWPFEHQILLHYSCGLVETYSALTKAHLEMPINWTCLESLTGGYDDPLDFKRFTVQGIEFKITSTHYDLEDWMYREACKLLTTKVTP